MAVKPYVFVQTQGKELAGYGRKKKDGYFVPVLARNLRVIKRAGLWDHITNPEAIPLPKPLNIAEYEKHHGYVAAYEYQKDSIHQIMQSYLPGHLLYLSPGLGKGIVSIVASELMDSREILIICTKSLMYMWANEIQKWSKDGENADIEMWNGIPKRYGKWNIANVEMFSVGVTHKPNTSDEYWPAEQFRRHWPMVIFDESILLQNRKAKRTKGMQSMVFDKILLCSGSPTSKYFDGLWSQLNIIWPEAFSSYWRFAQDVCQVERNGFATVINGNRDIDLAEQYRDIIIRKSQEEELPGLPDYIFRERDIELDSVQERAHETMTEDFIVELTNSPIPLEAVNKMSMLVRLQQIVSGMINVDPALRNSAKHQAVVEMIGLGDTEFPMLIWVNWVPSARDLHAKLTETFPNIKTGLAVGGEGEDIERYIQGEKDILILSLGMGKFGHTMTNTRHAVYVDRTFDGDAYVQSLARVRRIGLKHHPLMTVLRSPHSVDKLIEDNLAGKLVGIAQLGNMDLARLLRGIRRKR